MPNQRTVVLAALLGLLVLTGVAGAQAPRQYYGGWTYHAKNKYFYRYYYFKPTKDFVGYQYHYCIYTPEHPRYVYYFNPDSQKVWGRYDLESRADEAIYSVLAPADQRLRIGEIAKNRFPKPGPLAKIPQSTDGVQMAKLPNDWQDLLDQIEETESN